MNSIMEDCNIGKTRLSVQGRSAGDGMENAQFQTESNTDNKLCFETSKSKNYVKNFIPTPGKRKEPKFVPFEPYKAAVSPISLCHNKDLSKCVVPEKAKSLASEIIKQNSGVKELSSLPNGTEFDFSPSNDIYCKNCRNNSDSVDQIILFKEKLSKLEKDKNELEVQFNIQTQVNSDLKKMLIASLGEDMQMKVQYMTEDKAKLGSDVLFYVGQLTEKNEEIEKLSVACDVWKTKFEASSLMVKELALFKSVSTRKIKEINKVLESLMREHEEIFKQQQISYNILHHVQDAFNPSSKSSKKHCENDLLGISKEIRCLSNSIQSRLLGNSLLDLKSIVENTRHFTSAESIAYELLSNSSALPAFMRLNSCETSKLGPGLTACSIMPHACSKDATINCCNHCSGKVLLL